MEQSGGQAGRPQTPAQTSRNARPDGPAEVVDEHGHGNTPAAWAGVGVAFLGSLILAFAVVFGSWTWGIIGGVIALSSMVVAKVLSVMGHGAARKGDGHAVGAERPGAS